MGKEVLDFIGISLPLITIAGSAVAYLVKIYTDARREQRTHFYDLMAKIDEKGTIASKVTAVYQLREFPEHKDFVIRFCDSQMKNIEGQAAHILADEMAQTLKFMKEI
ncbi:hypothetical protein [Sulfitobacter sp. JB4-11]|uniref:hypothetical protein n=1 Tax=Sulfitobacter rhodophyticola TaxID=3238304 RepID=UPI003518CCEE